MNDKFRDECGVFGICGTAEAVAQTIKGLYALQHRGQESCGVAVSDRGRITRVCRMGGVRKLIGDEEVMTLAGSLAVGHVRFSTVGDSSLANAQPFLLECALGQIALCHNGQIVNLDALKIELSERGEALMTNSDSEIVLRLCKQSRQTTVAEALAEAIRRLDGAFSLVVLAKDGLIAARDSHGFRPLCVGRLGHAMIVCSETCALDAVGARYVQEVQPGEVIALSPGEIRTVRQLPPTPKAHCVFEHVYFARPDSYVFGSNVGMVRIRAGKILAREVPADADIVVPIPDSGTWVALGYHEESGIPLGMGVVRNGYVGRVFIEPGPDVRELGVNLKLNPVKSALAGKRVVLVDDSIVRGTTIRKTIAVVRETGAAEVHVRIGSPPVVAPCFYGIDMLRRSTLVASGRSVEEVRELIGADSLGYLSRDGLLAAVGPDQSNYCTACYTGKYPVPPVAGLVDCCVR